jgi:hypothetical protein
MKRSVCLSAVVAVLLMGTVVWSQSTAAATRQGALDRSSDLLRLLRPPSVAAGSKVVMNGSERMAEPLATAHIYKFATTDYPGASSSQTTGNANGMAVGIFSYGSGSGTQAFIYKGGVYSTLTVPGSTGTVAFSVNSLGQIVGEYADNSGAIHGFVDTAGTFTQVDFPGALQTAVTDMNAAGDMGESGSIAPHHTGSSIRAGCLRRSIFRELPKRKRRGSTLLTRWWGSTWTPAVGSTGSF